MNSVDENMLSHTKHAQILLRVFSATLRWPRSSGPLHNPIFSFSTHTVLTSDPYLPPKLYELLGVP